MKKVLFITPSLCQGGVEHSLITALENIDEKKYDITLYLYVDKLDLLPEVPPYVKTIVEIDKTKYFRKIKSAALLFMVYLCKLLKLKKAEDKFSKKLYAYIHKKKVEYPSKHGLKNKSFDAVVSYSVHIGSLMALEIPAKKRVLFLHSSDPYYHRDITEEVFQKFDEIVAVSGGVEAVYETAFPEIKDKLSVLKNFVDAEKVLKKGEEEFCEYEEHKKSGKTVVCSCGRLSEEKGYDMAVDAAKILKEKGIKFVWYFVADGKERGKIEKRIADFGLKGEVVITGYKENPYPYIKNCDIFVQPSYEEAQPIVLLETQILGKAIVSTETVGGKVILEKGEKGVLTEISAGGLAGGILKLIEDESLRKSFENLYTFETNLKEKSNYRSKWETLLGE